MRFSSFWAKVETSVYIGACVGLSAFILGGCAAGLDVGGAQIGAGIEQLSLRGELDPRRLHRPEPHIRYHAPRSYRPTGHEYDSVKLRKLIEVLH